MPLIKIDPYYEMQADGRQPVLVFSDQDHTMGLVVDEIVDIVEEHLKIQLAVDQAGLIGTGVIAGKATDVIDAGYYLIQAFGDWFGSIDQQKSAVDRSHAAKRILLVDDSSFFRNLMTPLLSVAGFDVTAVESADKALALREAGLDFDIIVSDIEMPGMSGFDLAAAIRADQRWQKVPMVALSSHATEKDFEVGRRVGFNDYVAKFDREALVQTITQTIALIGEEGMA